MSYILTRQDWKTIDLIPGLTLGKCIISSSFPLLAAKIIPTAQQAENAFLLANFLFLPIRQCFARSTFTFNSWIRDVALNAAVGGVHDSGHLLGSSVDFTADGTGMNASQLFAFIRDNIAWPGELLYYKKRGHIHADLPRLGVWADRKELDK
jgi:hypothetical protein